MVYPTIFEHLGDVESSLGKNSEAWEAYRSAWEKNPRDSKISRKLKRLESLLPPAAVQRKLLRRAIATVAQIASLKTNFVISGQLSDNNYRFMGLLQYARPENWRADIAGSFMAPQIVIVRRGADTTVFPRALQNSFASSGELILGDITGYFNATLMQKFDTDGAVSFQKGGSIIYTFNGEQLTIDRDNGFVREYAGPAGLRIRFDKQVWEEGLYLPRRIELSAPQEKISSEIELNNYHLNQELPENTFSTETLQ